MRPEPDRLRVALDATPLLGTRTGVGVFCQHLLEALGRRSDLRTGAFAVSWRRRGGIRADLPEGVEVLGRPMPARPLHWLWARGPRPPVELFTGGCQVVHGTNFVVPPTRRAARVLTVHDLTSVRFPEMCDDYTRHFPPLVRRAVAEGAWVHTPSAFVAAEVVEAFGAPSERVRAIHHGPTPLAPIGQEAPSAAVAQALEGEYLLALGTVEPRKDLPGLVRAFDALAGRFGDLRLVVAGADGWGRPAFDAAVAASPHRRRIIRLGYVSAADRTRLLAGAAVYVYPSLYEGFGLPPLEAMASGVPVVTTTAGALPEVAGPAALMVEPGDVDALAGAIERALSDSELRRHLEAAGRARVTQFSWLEAGGAMAGLYADAWAAR